MSDNLNQLFTEWKAHSRKNGYSNFICDGIVNEDVWSTQDVKICFLLKEAYMSESDKKIGFEWNLVKDTLNKGIIKKMWHSVAEWTYGILATTDTYIPPYKSISIEEKRELLKKISVVNVKKCDGDSSSVWENLQKITEKDKEFIKKELDIIRPDIIICGNNSSLLRTIFNDETIGVSDFKEKYYCIYQNMLIIDFFHPANHFPKFMNYYALCSIYQQALKERKFQK